MTKKILYVGLDVHKCSITIAIAASEANSPVRSYGEIDNRLGILDRVIGKLESKESELRFVYEAGVLAAIKSIVISPLKVITAQS